MGSAGEPEGDDDAPPPLSHLGANWPGAGSPLSAPPRPSQASPPRGLRRTRHSGRKRTRDRVTGLVVVAIVVAAALAVMQARSAGDQPAASEPNADRGDRAASTTTVPLLRPPTAPPAGFALGGEFVDAGSFIDGWATELGRTPRLRNRTCGWWPRSTTG